MSIAAAHRGTIFRQLMSDELDIKTHLHRSSATLPIESVAELAALLSRSTHLDALRSSGATASLQVNSRVTYGQLIGGNCSIANWSGDNINDMTGMYKTKKLFRNSKW